MYCVTSSMKSIVAPQRLFKFFWQIFRAPPFSFLHSCPAFSFSSPLPPLPRRPRPPPSEGAVGKLISIVIIAIFVVVFAIFVVVFVTSFCCHCQFCRCRGHQNVCVVVIITKILGPDTNRT